MLYCDNCKIFFKKPLLVLYTDADAFISKDVYACPKCKNQDYSDAFICQRCKKAYIEKGAFCPDCLKELKGIIIGFLDNFTQVEQEAMLDQVYHNAQ